MRQFLTNLFAYLLIFSVTVRGFTRGYSAGISGRGISSKTVIKAAKKAESDLPFNMEDIVNLCKKSLP